MGASSRAPDKAVMPPPSISTSSRHGVEEYNSSTSTSRNSPLSRKITVTLSVMEGDNGLVFTVSKTDASVKFWPARNNNYGRVEAGDSAFESWMSQLGQGLAEELNDVTEDKKRTAKLSGFPSGYGLFRYLRSGENNTVRCILYGSHGGATFHSPKEFFSHLRFLAKLDQHCRCRHCKADDNAIRNHTVENTNVLANPVPLPKPAISSIHLSANKERRPSSLTVKDPRIERKKLSSSIRRSESLNSSSSKEPSKPSHSELVSAQSSDHYKKPSDALTSKDIVAAIEKYVAEPIATRRDQEQSETNSSQGVTSTNRSTPSLPSTNTDKANNKVSQKSSFTQKNSPSKGSSNQTLSEKPSTTSIQTSSRKERRADESSTSHTPTKAPRSSASKNNRERSESDRPINQTPKNISNSSISSTQEKEKQSIQKSKNNTQVTSAAKTTLLDKSSSSKDQSPTLTQRFIKKTAGSVDTEIKQPVITIQKIAHSSLSSSSKQMTSSSNKIQDSSSKRSEVLVKSKSSANDSNLSSDSFASPNTPTISKDMLYAKNLSFNKESSEKTSDARNSTRHLTHSRRDNVNNAHPPKATSESKRNQSLHPDELSKKHMSLDSLTSINGISGNSIQGKRVERQERETIGIVDESDIVVVDSINRKKYSLENSAPTHNQSTPTAKSIGKIENNQDSSFQVKSKDSPKKNNMENPTVTSNQRQSIEVDSSESNLEKKRPSEPHQGREKVAKIINQTERILENKMHLEPSLREEMQKAKSLKSKQQSGKSFSDKETPTESSVVYSAVIKGNGGEPKSSKSSFSKSKSTMKRQLRSDATTTGATRITRSRNDATNKRDNKQFTFSSKEEYFGPFVNHERYEEIRQPFRIGELIWVKIEPISGDPDILYWPAVIIQTIIEPNAILKRRNNPPYPHEIEVVERYFVKTALLATSTVKDYEYSSILPWLSYCFPPTLLSLDLKSLKAVEPIFDMTIGEVKIDKPGITDFPTVETAITTFALAAQIAASIISFYSHFDKFLRPSFINESAIFALEDIHFQGIWWGAEKLWSGEIARILVTEEILPDEFENQEFGTQLPCYMMLINYFYRDSSREGAMMAGSIWKLVEGQVTKADEALMDEYDLPDPPSGMHFTRVTPFDHEHHLSIGQLAGRYYQDFQLEAAKAAALSSKSASVELNSDRVAYAADEIRDPTANIERVLALAGLRPSHRLFMRSQNWIANRKDTMVSAERKAELDMDEYLRSGLLLRTRQASDEHPEQRPGKKQRFTK